jgi:hypothetical protein
VLLGTPSVPWSTSNLVRVPWLGPGEAHSHHVDVTPREPGTVDVPVLEIKYVDQLGRVVRPDVPALALTVGAAPALAEYRPRARRRTAFVSYRHGDGSAAVFALVAAFRDAGLSAFDDNQLRPGDRWRPTLHRELSRAALVLAIIGPGWLTASTPTGRRRLDEPSDWVRVELASALERKIPVIPVLVDGARTPPEGELPGELVGLTVRQAEHWTAGAPIDGLLDAVDRFTR